MEAEKQAIREILEKRFGEKTKENNSESSSEEGTPRKHRRVSRNLVAKKRVGGGPKRNQGRGPQWHH